MTTSARYRTLGNPAPNPPLLCDIGPSRVPGNHALAGYGKTAWRLAMYHLAEVEDPFRRFLWVGPVRIRSRR